MPLDPVQLRVLGAIIEKEITTPESYPLSLNGLVNACNQRSSRDPVLDLGEDDVREALHTLEELALVSRVRDSRVPKYEHRARTVLNLRRDETAVLCLLLLRGPQTPGELRSRADRLYTFEDLGSVQSTLERLASRTADEGTGMFAGPLTAILPRQAGSREARYTHLLGGLADASTRHVSTGGTGEATPVPDSGTRQIDNMEAQLAGLSTALQALQERVERLESGERKSGDLRMPANGDSRIPANEDTG